MIITQYLLLLKYCLPLLIFSALLPQTCFCLYPTCSPSTCGNIRNISFPFRLKNDQKHCGRNINPDFELECENNVSTILYLNSQKYKVKAIHYGNNSIWLADVSVSKINPCTFPNTSLNDYFLSNYPYYLTVHDVPISLMRCPYGLKNNSLMFTELPPHCAASNSTHYTYIMLGNMIASDVIRDNCTVDLVMQTSWNFKDLKNVSVSEIHDSLLYGFQLSWPYEETCTSGLSAMLEDLWSTIKNPDYPYIPAGESQPAVAVIIILLIILVVFAGVTLPAMIIIGFTSAFAFIIIELNYLYYVRNFLVDYFPYNIGILFAERFVIVFPYIAWLFIYKFRRRHLSMFVAIENFLRSENNLLPIRYSYSDIKKMTRSFREKLGQGGFGTVYKGKLRSGYVVAVKLLGKPRENGTDQDFMNEIATIGRIHHVNVVKLVGYCAERSKRALVFDYMPNGSLDKYLYDREETNCLSWERKYDIALGVARGIDYLHKGCDIQILHFDIKPHNILLDDNFTPKITDFGLAKFFSPDKNVVTMTAIRGTIGYVAPELINRGFGEVSYKADVYSFGMLLIEMAGLNKDLRRNNQASSQYFPDWIYDSFEQGNAIDIAVTDENDGDREIVKKMAIVALWCIQMSPSDRPSMNKVVEMLEAQVERLRVPKRPTELSQIAVNEEDQSWSTYSTDSISVLPRDVVPNIEITVED